MKVLNYQGDRPMKRTVFFELKKWQDNPHKKPLLIRGARQVGKTYIVRQLGKEFKNFVEINFELYPDAKNIFNRDLDPARIVRDLSFFTGKKIEPGNTLVFFDEIQESPNAMKSLRYFYEMMPELHVVGAGSLLDFELEKIGLPVGRVSSVYLYPLSFMEFLAAKEEDVLIEAIIEHDTSQKMSETAHIRLLRLLGEYMTVGGLPEVVGRFIETADLARCFKIHRTINDTYRQDFNKYADKYQVKYVDVLFNTIPAILGNKFKYTGIPGEYRKRELKPALELLLKANIVSKVTHSSGQGIPLAAEANAEIFKMIFLDIALSQTLLGVDTGSWLLQPEVTFANKGALTEAFVGQELQSYSLPDCRSELYYWNRETRGSSAELDYLIQQGETILPVEVKSGSPGKLKSLRFYLDSHKNCPFGLRFSNANFSLDSDIRSFPLYAVCRLVPRTKELIHSLI
jgi:predicted AAA+ superfamily ATPase